MHHSTNHISDEGFYLEEIATRPHEQKNYENYLSYLEQADDPRAETIRTALAFANVDPLRQGLELENANAAWEKHKDAWLAPLKPYGITEATTDYGMPTGISISIKDFLEKGSDILTAYPQLSIRLQHTNDPQDIEALKHASRELYLLHSLDLSGNKQAKQILDAIQQNPGMHHIKHLNIANSNFSEDAFIKLYRSRFMGDIISLDARSNNLSDESFAVISGEKHSASLERLNLLGNPVGGTGYIALAGSQHLPKLKELVLGKDEAPDFAAQAIRNSKFLASLKPEGFHHVGGKAPSGAAAAR